MCVMAQTIIFLNTFIDDSCLNTLFSDHIGVVSYGPGASDSIVFVAQESVILFVMTLSVYVQT